MNNVIKPNAFSLPADFGDRLVAGLADTRANMVSTSGGMLLLRLLRNGQYVFGQNNEPIDDGARAAVNLATLARGWVCWGDGELLGQVMDSVQVPLPMRPAPIAGVAFQEQFGFELTFIDEADAGTTVAYKGNSYGFTKAFRKLISDIEQQWEADKRYFWPIIALHTSSYPHKKYGQIFEPVLEIVAWADENGQTASGPVMVKPNAAPPKAAPTRQRKVSPEPIIPAGMHVFTDANGPEPAPAPVSTQQAHVGQRRRPPTR